MSSQPFQIIYKNSVIAPIKFAPTLIETETVNLEFNGELSNEIYCEEVSLLSDSDEERFEIIEEDEEEKFIVISESEEEDLTTKDVNLGNNLRLGDENLETGSSNFNQFLSLNPNVTASTRSKILDVRKCQNSSELNQKSTIDVRTVPTVQIFGRKNKKSSNSSDENLFSPSDEPKFEVTVIKEEEELDILDDFEETDEPELNIGKLEIDLSGFEEGKKKKFLIL